MSVENVSQIPQVSKNLEAVLIPTKEQFSLLLDNLGDNTDNDKKPRPICVVCSSCTMCNFCRCSGECKVCSVCYACTRCVACSNNDTELVIRESTRINGG